VVTSSTVKSLFSLSSLQPQDLAEVNFIFSEDMEYCCREDKEEYG